MPQHGGGPPCRCRLEAFKIELLLAFQGVVEEPSPIPIALQQVAQRGPE